MIPPRSDDDSASRTPATELRLPPAESQAPTGALDRMETDEQKEGAGACEDPVTPRDVHPITSYHSPRGAVGPYLKTIDPRLPGRISYFF